MFIIEGMDKVRDVIEKNRKRQKKSEIQLLHEDLEACGTRLMKCKECFEIMGKDRNSYSKTDLKAASHANIESEKGILNRRIRSIQTEGHFGDIKENENFRRFNHRSSDKVYKEFMLYVIGQNINITKENKHTPPEMPAAKVLYFCGVLLILL